MKREANVLESKEIKITFLFDSYERYRRKKQRDDITRARETEIYVNCIYYKEVSCAFSCLC